MRVLRLLAAWLPAAVLVLMAPVYLCYLVQPSAGYFHDDGVYLVNGLSLASGHGFRTISLPDELFQTKYPFLYPALLALLWRLFPAFPANVFAFKLLSMCATGLWSYASYRLALRETKDAVLARWIAVLVVTLPWVVFLSGSAMPETLFALASTASLLAFQDDNSSRSGWKLALGAVLASAAFLLRSAGLALILSWLVLLLWRRRWRSAVAFCAITALLIGPWLVWQATHPATHDFVGAYYTKLSYEHKTVFSSPDSARALRAVGINVSITLASICPLSGPWFGPVSTVLNLLAGLLCMVGLARYLIHRQLTLPAVWFAANAAMVAAMMFSPVRYEVPMYAVSLIMFASGFSLLLVRIPARAQAAVVLLFAACAAVNVSGSFKLRQMTLQQGSPSWSLAPLDNWSQTMQATTWLREHTPRDTVIAANCDPVVFLYAQRKAIRLFIQDNYTLFFDPSPTKRPLGSSERLKTHLKANRVSYILMTPMKCYMEAPFLREQLASLMHSTPAAFRIEKRFADPDFYILSVDRDKL